MCSVITLIVRSSRSMRPRTTIALARSMALRARLLRHEREHVDVAGAYHAKVPMIKGCELGFVQAFSHGKHGGIDEPYVGIGIAVA